MFETEVRVERTTPYLAGVPGRHPRALGWVAVEVLPLARGGDAEQPPVAMGERQRRGLAPGRSPGRQHDVRRRAGWRWAGLVSGLFVPTRSGVSACCRVVLALLAPPRPTGLQRTLIGLGVPGRVPGRRYRLPVQYAVAPGGLGG